LSKLVRIETGAVSISTTDTRALLRLYGGTDEDDVRTLLAWAREGRRRTWWSRYSNVLSPQFISYLGYESSADVIWQFQALLIPGLLQTEQYARAVIRAGDKPERSVELLVEARLKRQELLSRADAPDMFFILDEAVLSRPIGGRNVMLDQLRHLKEISTLSNVTITVLPFEIGEHPALNGPFVVLQIADQTVVYLENSGGGLLSRDDPDEAAEYRTRFGRLEELADQGHRHDAVLDRMIRQLEAAA